ncbi:hypothetical protein GCM10009127_06020 [Alteraurantiacibacter aestuarii]|uniref:Uncharacterized protein n=1 Tax=Alteraurantiacibacter aestuarii TaxID=650004 RepID=A0A844ZPV0_9SPHN|nr:hypothetical protein [Alteraurantiacibacter aestuarii]MXO89080.1 hypothetical protein [Alteraurantiacibacter aestuarii]
MEISKHRKKVLGAGALAFVAAIAAGIAGGQILRLGGGNLPFAVTFALLTFVLIAALLATRPWWNRLDDVERDAHTNSFYWGGTFGAGTAMLGLVAWAGTQSDLARGSLITFAAMTAGYGVFWLVWWLRRRGEA